VNFPSSGGALNDHFGSYAWDFSFDGATVLAATSKASTGVYKVLIENNNDLDSLGNGVILKHEINGKLFFSTYGHMASTGVTVGAFSGQSLGISGNTGTKTNGSHLHFQVTQLYDSEQEWTNSNNGTRATSVGSDFSSVVFPTALGTVFGGLIVRGNVNINSNPGLLDDFGAKKIPVLPNLFLNNGEGGDISATGDSQENIISGMMQITLFLALVDLMCYFQAAAMTLFTVRAVMSMMAQPM